MNPALLLVSGAIVLSGALVAIAQPGPAQKAITEPEYVVIPGEIKRLEKLAVDGLSFGDAR